MIRYLLLFILLVSCAHQKMAHKPLFPYGVYQHVVNLEVKGKAYQFPGINRWTKDELSMVGLGPLNMTMLKYNEKFANNKKEIYLNKNFIPLTEGKALLYLSVMKEIYSLDHSICEKSLCRKNFYGQNFFFDLNEKGQVSHIRVARGETKIDVEVVDFEELP